MPRKYQTPNYEFDILPGEVFVVIQDFENYSISNFGRIISYTQKRPKLLAPGKDAMGYLHYRLYNRTEADTLNVQLFKAHRLVAMYFVQKPREYSVAPLEVNHIDGDKTNNISSNLEWVTRSENLKHAVRIGLRKVFHANVMNRKPVEIFKHGISIGQYDTILDASADLNLSAQSISNWLKGKNISQKGYTAKFLPKNQLYKRVVTKDPVLKVKSLQLN